MSPVAPFSQDGSKDYWIPTARAQALFNEGKLAIDCTNSYKVRTYCHAVGIDKHTKFN
jgi:hypothetical protein